MKLMLLHKPITTLGAGSMTGQLYHVLWSLGCHMLSHLILSLVIVVTRGVGLHRLFACCLAYVMHISMHHLHDAICCMLSMPFG
jgi:hypothetical protein